LVLYYNRTLLNQANLANPPATWAEFKEAVKALTKLNRDGEIVQSGAALGGARNINRAPDILAVLMMQNGTEMTDSSGRAAAFNAVPAALADKGVRPGQDALRFYADFANPTKEVYSWNEKMPESLNAFAAQKTAFFFGYAYHLPLIRSLAPNLNLGIAKLPQIATDGKPVNFANYWLEAVTKQSKNPAAAWAFIQFAAGAPQVKSFLNRANKPTALRALISDQRQNDDLVNFADQVLTARSWYRGKNTAAMEEALRVMIEQAASNKAKPEEAVNLAAQKVNETF
jgi:multiple sugar transport system substrate-binding protein